MSDVPVYHVPVLLGPTIDGLDVRPDGVYVDVTFGGGGHSREILRRLGPGGRLFSFDQDRDALRNVPDDGRLTFILGNFRWLTNWMHYYGVEQIDGLLADLGVSSHHFDDAGRGFSFRYEGLLDMRMNRQAHSTAADVVNTYTDRQLADVFYLYGELRNARRLADALVRARSRQRIETVTQFLDVVAPLFGRDREKKELAKVFQALRIEVNDEMGALRQMLQGAVSLLRPGGRLSVLTYHSLEDRIVKNYIRSGNAEGRVEKDFYGNVLTPLRPLSNKVLVPDEEEQMKNPRSRSAKLRVAEKK